MSAGDPWVGTVIDVSKWQSSLPSLSGVLGVIARAGIGTKPDPMFEDHIYNARKAGKWVGSYWYNWGDLSVSDQVNAYIARERGVGGVQLHAIDWEGVDGFTAGQTAEFIRIYRARTGHPILLYASESRFRDLGQDANWIANYLREPIKPYDMWQYGPFRGVDGNNANQRILDLVIRSQVALQAPIDNETPMLVTAAAGHTWYDLDGKTILETNRPVLGLRLSPYGSGPARAIFATVDGRRRTVLINPASIEPVPSTVIDTWTPEEQARLDATVASAAAAARIEGRLEGVSAEQDRVLGLVRSGLGI